MAPPWLLSAALRGALVAALALLALVPLGRASASLRHGVLLLALGALALLPLASALLPAWRVALGPLPEAVSGLVVDESTRPLAAAPPSPRAPSPAALAAPAAGPGAPARAGSPLAARGGALTLLWAAGALFFLARLGGAQAKAVAIVRRARPLAGGAWAADVARAARLVGVRPPRVLVSDEVGGPAVAGLARPALLLPPAALGWGPALRQAVLLHELAHLRRGDLQTNLLAGFVKALHWFDPLVWALARRLHHERELSADAFALRAGVRPSSYAESLLAVAAAGRAPGALLAMAQRPLLSRRIEAALGPGAGAAAGPLARLASFAVGAPLALALACASPDAPPAPRAAAGPAPAPAPRAAPPEPRAEAVARALGVAPERVELTLDEGLQRAAEAEVERLAARHAAATLNVVIVRPSDGAVLALAGRSPRAGEEVAVERAYVHGSTMKPVTMAAALEEGKLLASDRIAYGGAAHDLGELLATSSNEGTAVVFRRLGGEALGRWQRRFHFGERPPADALPLAGATAGALPGPAGERAGAALAAIGAGLSASPLQVAAAYAAIANGGVYHAPALVRRVRDEAGRTTWEHRPAGERVLRPETARTLLGLLAEVVESPKGTGRAARVEGARVGGKTGTVESEDSAGARGPYASFVGVAPLEAPRYVIAVGVEGARGSGGELAAPSFARLAA
ncbi:MAG TPA: penicillin-binding transpeptidase domain-containing protein, partial [Polyangiaceae bacterium]|nr:penicillin-binding transpeptidase domain-containing protein [Polyangiaceae bacterium]